jgi:hypothetical protein
MNPFDSDPTLVVHQRPDGHVVCRIEAGPFSTNAAAWRWIDRHGYRRKNYDIACAVISAQPEAELRCECGGQAPRDFYLERGEGTALLKCKRCQRGLLRISTHLEIPVEPECEPDGSGKQTEYLK